MEKFVRTSSSRLVALLWMLFMAVTGVVAADNTSDGSSGSNAVVEEVMEYNFKANPEIIAGLATGVTGWGTTNRHVTLSVNNYTFTLHNCLRGDGYLSVRGDYNDKDAGDDPGYLQGSMKGTMTQLTIDKLAGKGKINLLVEDADGNVKTFTQDVVRAGTVTFDIPANERVADARSITVKPNFKLNISRITITRVDGQPDTEMPWTIFSTVNSDPTKVEVFPAESGTCNVAVGQVVRLASNGIEGFDPVSTMANPYVVTYTVDGSEPQFSAQKDSNGKYWKNGGDNDASGNPIGLNGYVYRRGIVLEPADGSSETTVRIGIFRVTGSDGDKYTYNKVKEEQKTFVFTSTPTRPRWDSGDSWVGGSDGKDLVFVPDTKEKASDVTEGWTKNMTVLDPTENVTVMETHWNGDNTIIAKFSKNDKYDLQSLLNSASVSPAVGQKSMKSSELKRRKVSAMQYTPDGLASNAVAEAFYWFIPARKQLYLEATSANMTDEGIKLNIATGSTSVTENVKVRAYWLNGSDKTPVSMKEIGLTKEGISFGDGFVAAVTSDIVLSDDGMEAAFDVTGQDNGVTSMTIHTEKTNNVSQTNDTETETADNYTAATTTVTVNVEGGDRIMPPAVTPYSRSYADNFDATVTGRDGVKTYWMLVDNSDATPMAANGQDDVYDDPLPMEDIIEMAKTFDASNPDRQIPAAGIIDGAKTATASILAKANANYTLYAVAVTEKADGSVDKRSRIVWSQYTYSKLENPVLTPGIEGNSNSYPFSGELHVEANVESQNAQIYYLVDGDLNFTITANGTVQTNGHLFDASTPIVVNTTCTVQAIAYSDALGIKSDIVSYRYALKTSDINEPTFIIGDTEYTNGDKCTGKLDGTNITLKATYYDADGELKYIGGDKKVSWDSDTYHIYYTIDGSDISAGSLKYTGPFSIYNSKGNVKITAAVFADGNGGDRSISDISVLYILDSGIAYWETSDSNCDNGVLKDGYRNTGIVRDGETLVNIEFGSSKNAAGGELAWKHYTSKEYATGNPIDNIGKYTIAPAIDAEEDVADVCDEMGSLWNHSRANDGTADFQTHKATYGLPASGAYVKFEPQRSGRLTIWCCQEGALYYSNRSTDRASFNEGFLRKRPAYFVDEAGRSLKPVTVEAAGVLSSNWNTDVRPGDWNTKDTEVNGIKQTLYTSRQTEKIYDMFNSVILAKGAEPNSSLQPLIVYLNTEANKTVAGFNVAEDPKSESEDDGTGYTPDPIVDSTGVCLPSASYMKYTFDVEAGKTYFFFGWMTKIGIRGFGFEPTGSAASEQLTVYSGRSATGEGGNSDSNSFTVGKTYAKAVVDRKFTADRWTTLVLPFSVSASQLKKVFGENTKVLHYRTIANQTMYFFEHYHQMIVAGTPVIVKPSLTVDKPEFENVTVESAKVVDRPCNDYGFNGVTSTEFQMQGSYNVQTVDNGNYYFSTNGTVKRLSSNSGSAPLSGTRAYIVGTDAVGTPVSLSRMARMAYNDLTPTDMAGEATGIEGVGADAGGDNAAASAGRRKVYDTAGQFVGKSDDGTKGLATGIYIVDGKKVTVK